MRLESGPARMDTLRPAIFALFALAFAVYFFYDWKTGYVAENRARARERLTPIVGAEHIPAVLGERPAKEDWEAFQAANVSKVEEAKARLGGEPKFIINSPVMGESKHFFVSDYGVATVQVQNGAVVPSKSTFEDWPHKRSETQAQLYWGLGAVVIGLWAAYMAVKAALVRVVIDDQGMRYGSRFIPFDAMERLSDYKRKGLCTLHYRDAAGEPRTLRIDSWAVAKFEEIIDALCAAKNWPNPRAATESAPPPGGGQPTGT